MKPWTIFGAAGSEVSMAWNPPSVHTGVRLPKILCPLIDQPPSVRAGRGGGQHHRHVVAGLAVEGAEHLTGRGPVEDEPARFVAGTEQIGGDTGPVDVHVDGERRRRGVVAQPAEEPRVLVEAGAAAAELGRDGDVEEAAGSQLGEVLVEEPVLAVVGLGSFVEAGEHLVGEHVDGRRGALGGGHRSVWSFLIFRDGGDRVDWRRVSRRLSAE